MVCICCSNRFRNVPTTYFVKLVCFNCRLVRGIKNPKKLRINNIDIKDDIIKDELKAHCNKRKINIPCSNCHQNMCNAGMKFAPPKKTDIKSWNYMKNNWNIC